MIHSDRRGASVHAPDMEDSPLPTAADHVGGGGRAIPRDLTPEAAAHLTAAGGYPCISVLMPTTPAARMAIADRERLEGLLLDAERRLDDQPLGDRERLMYELRRQARIAQDSSTRNALGLFVSHSVSRAWTRDDRLGHGRAAGHGAVCCLRILHQRSEGLDLELQPDEAGVPRENVGNAATAEAAG